MRITLPKLSPFLHLGIFLMVIKVSCNSSDILFYSETMDTVLALIAAGLFAVEIFRQKYTGKIIAVNMLIGALALYCVVITGNYGFLITVLLCMAIRESSFDVVIRHIWVYELCFLLMHTSCSFVCGLFLGMPNWQDIYGVIRYDFGFVHPNMFSMYVFNLILMWVWLYYDQIKKEHIVMIMIVMGMVSLFTKTRTSFLDAMFLCFLLLFLKQETKDREKGLTFCVKGIVPFLTVIILWLCITYPMGCKINQLADRVLNSRIRLGGYAYDHYGITVFGQNLSDVEAVWDPVWQITGDTFDNIYTALAMNYGVIWIILISLFFYKLARQNNKKINICLLMWAMYGVTETHGLNGFLCFPILLITLLYDEGKKKRYE